MILVPQNKEKVLRFGRAFSALEYNEDVCRKGKKEEIRHTICISDGCLEEVAEYESKERCLEVLQLFKQKAHDFSIDGYTDQFYQIWGRAFGDYGSISSSYERLTEENIINVGTYAEQLSVVYDNKPCANLRPTKSLGVRVRQKFLPVTAMHPLLPVVNQSVGFSSAEGRI